MTKKKRKKYHYNNYVSSPYIELGLHGCEARGITKYKNFNGIESLRNARKKKKNIDKFPQLTKI